MVEELKAVRDAVFKRDGGYSGGVVYDVDGVRHYHGLVIGINDLLAAVVLEGDTSN